MPATSTGSRRVLVAPLDWGLGHATRCIAVIRSLRERGHEVIVGGAGTVPAVLVAEFPGLTTVPLVKYGVSYAAGPLRLALKFPFLVARVFARAAAEHRLLERIIAEHGIEAVISDQRFGCYSRRVPCAYISHQLCVKMPRRFAVLERLVWRGLSHAAGRYDRLWIPDLPGDTNLTGELSRKYPLPANHRFIGPLSRFGPQQRDGGPEIDLLVLLSGPEPQRSVLERRVRAQLAHFDGRAVVLLGRPGAESSVEGGTELLAHASTAEIGRLLARARAVVCRAGYTTIMELVSLGRKAVLVPTPGQTEQEYLAAHLRAQGYFAVESQATFDLTRALATLATVPGPPPIPTDGKLLDRAVTDLLAQASHHPS